MQLQEILYSQGFGTRRVCAGLVQQGYVTVQGRAVDDAFAEFEAVDGLAFTVQGTPWIYQAKAYLMLHKPAGTECSQKPSTYPSIYTLLPAPLVLPAMSVLMVAGGFAIAAVLYLAGRRLEREPSAGWLIAGAFLFLGFAAALMSDSDTAVALLEQMQATSLAALSR